MAGDYFFLGEDTLREILRECRKVKGMTLRGPHVKFVNDGNGISGFIGGPEGGGEEGPDDRGVLVKITDPESGGGKYAGYILRPPTTAATASGDLTEAEIGVVTDATNCLILNTREVGKSTHDLASSGYLPLVFPGRIVGVTAEGKPIVVIDGAQQKDCS